MTMINRPQLKAEAREHLRGKWGPSVLVSFLAGLLTGGGSYSTGGSSVATNQPSGAEYGNITMPSQSMSGGVMGAILGVVLIFALVAIIVGPMIQLGEKNYFIKLTKNEPTAVGDLLSRKHIFFKALLMQLYLGLRIFLWSLLLVVPGIIAALRYSLADYLMAENPELSITDAIEESKRLMYGRKMELFILGLSFLGWVLLGACTLGIGLLFVAPYYHAAMAGFYLKVKQDYYGTSGGSASFAGSYDPQNPNNDNRI